MEPEMEPEGAYMLPEPESSSNLMEPEMVLRSLRVGIRNAPLSQVVEEVQKDYKYCDKHVGAKLYV